MKIFHRTDVIGTHYKTIGSNIHQKSWAGLKDPEAHGLENYELDQQKQKSWAMGI